MADEEPEHIWYRGRQFSPDSWALVCVKGYYHWGTVSDSVAQNFPAWTEELYLQNLDTIAGAEAAGIRQAYDQGEEISWQLP